jgi:hypothetical protein
MWNARIAGVEKLNNFISVAFFASRLIFEDIRRPSELNEILICMAIYCLSADRSERTSLAVLVYSLNHR